MKVFVVAMHVDREHFPSGYSFEQGSTWDLQMYQIHQINHTMSS